LNIRSRRLVIHWAAGFFIMKQSSYRNRRAVELESDQLRLTVLAEGGHIARIEHRATGVNPLWTPPWPSLEPSHYDATRHPEYGQNVESRLLAGIMGHNVCLDIFGAPSAEEAAAGLDVHGEAATARYQIDDDAGGLLCRCELPEAGLRFTRRIGFAGDGSVVSIREAVENVRGTDRAVGWTQHVTLGPPFLEKGVTQFRANGTRSVVFDGEFAGEFGRQMPGAGFHWPNVPLKGGGAEDLQLFTGEPVSGGFTTTLMDPADEQAFFVAYSPTSRLNFGYRWRRADFPWLGRWEENLSRKTPPWNGETIALGLEFGVSPMPESRREMIERGSLFGQPGFRWIPAHSTVEVAYHAFLKPADTIPERPPLGI